MPGFARFSRGRTARKPRGAASLASGLRLALVLFILILVSSPARAALPAGSDGPRADCGNLATIIRPQYRPNTVYVIPVVFHVIMDIQGKGYLSEQQIQDQVRVLNEDFRAMAGTYGAGGYDTRIRFELEGITRTFNDEWFQCGNELEFKTALGWDQGRYLNIYTNLAWQTVSYAYQPADYAGSVWDGVVLYYQSVGGRDQPGREPRDQGRTAVHEIGHYLGLLDTYNDGCAGGYESGDLIMDTNPELEPHLACGPSYSCGGLDPVHNYMSGAGDACKTSFTPEQANRMVCTLQNYRPLLCRPQNLGGQILPLIAPVSLPSGPLSD